MCLYIDRITTRQELEKEFDTRTFYKLFVIKKNYIQTPYFDFKVTGPGLVTLPGDVRPLSFEEIADDAMVQGRAFHVRTTKDLKIDKFFVNFFDKGKFVVVLPVTVKKEDIICFGLQDQVAVKTYNISKESWSSIDWKI